MNTDITFIIADNQDITRMGMHGYISAIFSGCRMIDVTDKKELMLALVECNDSVVILDYTLFDINGIEEFLIIEKRFPRVRWILFSNELSEDFIRRMSIARNIGMILKENSGEEIHSALMCTAHGERFLCHQITNITHKKNIFRKLGVNNVYEATKYTLRAGLIEMIEYYI